MEAFDYRRRGRDTQQSTGRGAGMPVDLSGGQYVVVEVRRAWMCVCEFQESREGDAHSFLYWRRSSRRPCRSDQAENTQLMEWRKRAGGVVIDAESTWVEHLPDVAVRFGGFCFIVV